MTARPYKVICISVYVDELADIDAKVEELKARGVTTANRSQLIRVSTAAMTIDRAAELMRKP